MSTMQENNVVPMNAEVKTVEEKKPGLLTKLKNKVKTIDKKKVVRTLIHTAETVAVGLLCYKVGTKVGMETVAIPAEGTVEETETNETEAEEGAAE